MGKLMEKAGGMLKNDNIAEKGRAKREEKGFGDNDNSYGGSNQDSSYGSTNQDSSYGDSGRGGNNNY